MNYKSYSRKKSTKKTPGIISAAAKTLFVLAAAVWFLSGFNRTPSGGFDASVGAEQITVEMPDTENANVNEVQNDEFVEVDEDENSFAQPVCGVLTSSFEAAAVGGIPASTSGLIRVRRFLRRQAEPLPFLGR